MEIKIPIEISDEIMEKAIQKAVDERLEEYKQNEELVLVTRCKDCKFSKLLYGLEKQFYKNGAIKCAKMSTDYFPVIISEDNFCSYAEPKESEDGE